VVVDSGKVVAARVVAAKAADKVAVAARKVVRVAADKVVVAGAAVVVKVVGAGIAS
jgi:hypothetical protein